MNEDSNNTGTSSSIENLRNDLETLKIDLLKTKQELDGWLHSNLRSSKDLIHQEHDVTEGHKNEFEREVECHDTMNSYNIKNEDVMQCLQQRIQCAVASLRFLNMAFDELKNVNGTAENYCVQR